MQSRITAFVVSLIFAFSKTFWSSAVSAEVYTLTAFFVILLLYLFQLNCFYLSIFFLGFGIAHHHMILYFLPISLVYIFLLFQREKLNLNKFLNGALFFLLGLSIYFYLPIRSISNPAIDWGNPENLKNFIRHITRTQYSFKTYHGYSIILFLAQLKSYLNTFFNQFGIITYILIFIGSLGLFKLFKIKKSFFVINVIVFLAMSLGFILIINFNITVKNLYVVDIFYIPSYMIFSIWVFYGLVYLLNKFKNKLNISFGAVIFLFPLFTFFSNFNYNDLSKNYILEKYGKNIFKTIERKSIIFVSGDNPMFSLVYLQKVEKFGEDIKIYDDFGSVFENIYENDFLFLPKLDHDRIINNTQLDIITRSENSVYCTLGSNPYKFPQFEKIPYGLLYKLVKKNKVKREEVENFFDKYSMEWSKDKRIYDDYLAKEIVCRYYFAQGEYYLYIKNNTKAKEYYLKALDLSEGIEWIETHLGDVFSILDSKREALESYLKVVGNNPYNADAHNNLGVLYLNRGEIEKAKAEFEKALKINQNHAASLNNLGTVYLKRGNKVEAYNFYRKAISIDNNQADAHSNLGSLYAEDGNFDRAIEEFEKTLELNPSDKKALNNLGVIYFLKGNNEKALQFLEKTVKIDSNADTYNNLGSVYAKMNKIDLAIKMWKKALGIDPNHKDAKENLKKVNKQ